jgi:hypothetical protein
MVKRDRHLPPRRGRASERPIFEDIDLPGRVSTGDDDPCLVAVRVRGDSRIDRDDDAHKIGRFSDAMNLNHLMGPQRVFICREIFSLELLSPDPRPFVVFPESCSSFSISWSSDAGRGVVVSIARAHPTRSAGSMTLHQVEERSVQ